MATTISGAFTEFKTALTEKLGSLSSNSYFVTDPNSPNTLTVNRNLKIQGDISLSGEVLANENYPIYPAVAGEGLAVDGYNSLTLVSTLVTGDADLEAFNKVTLNTDGSITATTNGIFDAASLATLASKKWHNPITANIGERYWVKFRVVGGGGVYTPVAGEQLGVWLPLTSPRSVSNRIKGYVNSQIYFNIEIASGELVPNNVGSGSFNIIMNKNTA